jgi:hypothetical protein
MSFKIKNASFSPKVCLHKSLFAQKFVRTKVCSHKSLFAQKFVCTKVVRTKAALPLSVRCKIVPTSASCQFEFKEIPCLQLLAKLMQKSLTTYAGPFCQRNNVVMLRRQSSFGRGNNRAQKTENPIPKVSNVTISNVPIFGFENSFPVLIAYFRL